MEWLGNWITKCSFYCYVHVCTNGVSVSSMPSVPRFKTHIHIHTKTLKYKTGVQVKREICEYVYKNYNFGCRVEGKEWLKIKTI